MSLHYQFPVITNISDVLPYIQGKPEFIVVDKGEYTVINYAFQTSDTFPPVTDTASAILRECRGLIFNTATGELLSRAFHKFFNIGERQDTTVIDVTRPHRFETKLDGSMVRPLFLRDGIRWATKMGVTNVSMQAEVFVASRPYYGQLAQFCCERNWTPIFEWLSRENQIVLDYGREDQLVLLAVRDNIEGGYIPRSIVADLAIKWGIPIVDKVERSDTSSFDDYVAALKAQEDIEGIVVIFTDGHRVKVKTDWYVQMHRAKDRISSERHVIALVLNDELDDLLPMLPEDDRKRVQRFADAVQYDLTFFSEAVFTVLYRVRQQGWDRKCFALHSETFYPLPVRAACFRLFEESLDNVKAKAREWGRNYVLKNIGSKSALAKAHEVLQTVRWKETVE